MRAISISCFLLLSSAYVWCHDEVTAPKGIINSFGIYGGKAVNITEAPYMALFRPKTYNWHCGAAIINEQYLVTAGHCAVPDIANMRITVGSANVDGGKDYEIEKIFRHPKYYMNTTLIDYDISVVKLKEKLKFGDKIKSIPIADTTLPKSGDMLESLGFGKTEKNKPSKILLKVDLQYVDRESCHHSNSPFIISRQMICAGHGDGRDTCHSDSGGPIVYKGKLIGVTSWIYYGMCNVKGHPDGFAYIPSMKKFIDDVIKQ